MQSESLVYRPALPPGDLIDAIRTLLARQREAERLVCRYLADLADHIDARGFGYMHGFGDIYHASRCLFAMGVRRTRERVRVGRALRELPRIDQALVDGSVSYSRVRELTRVARAADELRWLQLARELPMRILERRVAEAGGTPARDKTSEPAAVTWTSPRSLEVRLSLRAETWALLERAMEGARRAADSDALLSDDEALAAIARDALAHQASDTSSELRRAVVLYECRSCGRTELETGAAAVELDDASAAARACGAPVRDLATEGRIVRRGGPLPSSVERAVRLRDRDRCRVPSCSRRRYVDVHHLDERAKGGVHSRRNCLCLCDTHHRMLHEGALVIAGDPEAALEFRDAEGRPLVDPLSAPASVAVTQGGSPQASSLLASMGTRGGWDVDALCEATGLSAGIVAAELMTLELAGRVARGVGNRYRLTAARA